MSPPQIVEYDSLDGLKADDDGNCDYCDLQLNILDLWLEVA